MDDIALARALHVAAVVLWIGGVGFVTTVLLPTTRRRAEVEEGLRLFDVFESGFARQARITTLLAGASGLYMIVRLDLWYRFAQVGFWWMHAMVLVWLLFSLMLFAAEPCFLQRRIAARAQTAPAGTFRAIEWLHRLLLALSLLTILGAVAGSHGLLY